MSSGCPLDVLFLPEQLWKAAEKRNQRISPLYPENLQLRGHGSKYKITFLSYEVAIFSRPVDCVGINPRRIIPAPSQQTSTVWPSPPAPSDTVSSHVTQRGLLHFEPDSLLQKQSPGPVRGTMGIGSLVADAWE
ncbi:unnamed protein product [Pleuronectes platessa]|uniref:Uncharacterized protein n=1 Tax=Pleuronectes platessa TaxID=8262 RepID=A0A9N7VZ32_PLEPL|nr:unnamed protein product [Pleuronectes platessa]